MDSWSGLTSQTNMISAWLTNHCLDRRLMKAGLLWTWVQQRIPQKMRDQSVFTQFSSSFHQDSLSKLNPISVDEAIFEADANRDLPRPRDGRVFFQNQHPKSIYNLWKSTKESVFIYVFICFLHSNIFSPSFCWEKYPPRGWSGKNPIQAPPDLWPGLLLRCCWGASEGSSWKWPF